MESHLRKEELDKIKEGRPAGTDSIDYKNKNQTMNVYEIPLEYLIFNQYNGRILTFVKTYEKEHSIIDATKPEGEELIAQFLWDSRIDRNKYTKQDLKERGQFRPGIVTADGVVIDGNRRFMLLKKNAEENNDATAYFKAIILEDTLDSNEKEIRCLETTCQLGMDGTVDYNPIQKYLTCRAHREYGITEDAIAKMMGEKAGEITRYLNTLELMDEYLKTYDYDGMYRVLEIEKLEGHFVDLNRFLSKYKGGRKIQDMDWMPDITDFDDLKKIYFDYMRAGFGVHDIRFIADPAKGKGIFTKKEIWETFSKKYFGEITPIKDQEKPLGKMREENPTTEVEAIRKARDDGYKNKAGDTLKKHSGRSRRELEDQNSQNQPLELLERAQKTLEKVDSEVKGFGCQEIRDLAKTIQNTAYGFMKEADKQMKSK